jgi:hypothetical protein
LGPAVDVPELRVAVRVLFALDDLAVGLKAVAERMKQLADHRAPHAVSLRGQLIG